MRWSITAGPIYGQPVEECLDRDEVEDAIILTSHPGTLNVWFRPGTPRSVADEIVECLRALPGEPLQVRLAPADPRPADEG